MSQPPSTKEDAGDLHQKLVRALIKKFVLEGLEILKAADEGYEEPYKIGRHKPDIIARDAQKETFSIGEAKICDDLTSDRTKEQFEDFSSRVMGEGKSKGTTVSFHVVVPKSCEDNAWLMFRTLGLSDRINIKVWTHG